MVVVVRYRVLGPVSAAEGFGPAALGGPRARAVLALLLMDAGRVVTDRQLVQGLWGDEAPEGAQHAIQNHVSRLRNVIDDEILRDGGGYRLAVDPMAVDAHRFMSLVASGRERLADAPAAAALLLREALALWHGEPYADVDDVPGLQPEIRRLQAARLSAVEDRVQADLDAGRHTEIAAELEGLVREHPFRERLYGMQMLALYRAGRQAEALDVYQRARLVLADELGIDPSPELAGLHERILTQDPTLGAPERHTTDATHTAGAEQLDNSLPVISGFELREQVGDGDFGRTFRAYHASLGREVALKVLHRELSDLPDVVRGFERRAQRIAQLDHPHVVPLLDSWRSPGAAHLVTPWVPAGSVRSALRHGPWTPAAALRMIEHVGAALELAHRRGIAHGDVKAANILLSDDGSARLSDFAVTPRLRDALGAPHTNDLGAIAPEERRGGPPSAAGDVHGLGAVAIEVLTGTRVPAETPAAILEQHAGELPRGLVEALTAATAPDPRQRPVRVADLLRQLRRVLGADVIPPAGLIDGAQTAVRNPYKGLHAFTEDDAVDFFGRDAAVERLVQAVAEHRLVAVVGPSGSGKSSIVRAGAIPALRSGALAGSEQWLFADLYPGSHPFDELAVALLRVAVDPPANMVAALTADERGLARVVKQILPGDDTRLLLVVDQFEELFSLTSDAAVRRAFLDSLVALADDARGRVRTIVTLRADFFDRPLEHHEFGELLRTGLVGLTVPSRDELAQAVTAPARHVGIEFEPGLVTRIVADVVDQPGGLPLLQHALTELCARRDGHVLTERAYDDAGGVHGALARRAEELYTALPPTRRDLARQVLLRLVTVDEEAGATRRRARRTELAELTADRSAVDDVLQRFGAHRLLTFDRDPVSRGSTVEVAHEALLAEWGRLRRWIDDRRDDLLLHRRLAQDAAEWREADRAAGFLLTGGRLEQFSQFAASTDLALDRDEREYLAASQRHADVVTRQRRRQRRLLGVALGCVALLAAAFVVFGVVQRERDSARDRSRHAAALASASRTAQSRDLDLSLLLAREAVRATRAVDEPPTSDALGALHEAVLAHRLVTSIDMNSYAVTFVDEDHLISPSTDETPPEIWNIASGASVRTLEGGPLNSIDRAVSPDGRRYAEVYGGAPTTVWDLESGRVLRRIPAASPDQEWPAFDPNGEVLAVVNTGYEDDEPETVSVYDVATGEALHRISVPDTTGRMAISPDGRTLAVTSQNEPVVRLFNLADGELRDTLRGPPEAERAAGIAFHPRGDTAAVLYPPELHIHKLPSGAVARSLRIDRDDSVDVCYSADGSALAVTSLDDAIDVYEGNTGAPLVSLPAAGMFSSATCSPDGTQVAAGTVSGLTQVWDITAAGAVETWSTAAPAPWTAVWAGDQIISTHRDRRIRRHDPDTGRTTTSDVALPVAPPLPVAAAGARRYVASTTRNDPASSQDRAKHGLVLRDADSLHVVREFAIDGEPLAFSGDGSKLLARSTVDTEHVHISDPTDGTLIASYEMPEGGFVPLGGTFLPDGRHIAVDEMATTWLFDTSTGEIAATVCAEEFGTNVVASPDGELLVLDGRRGIEVFDLSRVFSLGANTPETCADAGTNPSDAARVRLLEGARVRFMAFSPDGTQLASVSETGSVSLWDPRTGDLLFAIPHEGEVGGGAFSDDGRHLAVTLDAPDDAADAVRIYTLDADELLDIADTKATRELTPEECAGYHIADPCGSATGPSD